ncbi:YpzG family protein [Bacillus sp. CLL-7-23]|uniref:YpzG family protein n=1 Tax=Bacillus changyiensis TaxID=3004103 RepID=A0ABT4X308_9BACI|nr:MULTISPECIES: YpzG family protein [Bacillus]MDA1478326.1 YpzG family protein [Bacillus changyiensis]MDA7026634.1 YpzG family protein [Bacillus changyiensis]
MCANRKPYMNDFNQMKTENFPQPWANTKHARAQVNGETQQTQDLIILQRNTRIRTR